MLPLIIGIVSGVCMAGAARLVAFDRDRSYYPTVLIFIAAYYVFFAFMAGEGIVAEILVATVFTTIAVIGAYTRLLWVGIGIVLHGVFDWIHPHLITNGGVPLWWPAFCAGIDIVLGAWVIRMAMTRDASPAPAAA